MNQLAQIETPKQATSLARRQIQFVGLLFQRDGKLTRELVSDPGRFGLGQDARQKQTRCRHHRRLRLLLDRLRLERASQGWRQAVNISPEPTIR